MPGLQVVAVKGEELNHLKCIKCCLLSKDPVQLDTGERICFTCLEDPKKMTRDGTLLSIQSEVGKGNLMYKDKYAESEIESVIVYCFYAENGCSWTGQVKEYQSHVDCCDFCPELCQQCGHDIQNRLLQKHLLEDCPERMSMCNFCGEVVTHGSLTSHLKTCKEKPLECNQCNISLPPDELRDHEDMWCDDTSNQCPFKEEGCKENQVYTKKELSVHIMDTLTFHIFLLLIRLRLLKRFITEVSTKLSSMKDELYPRLERLFLLFEDLELKVLSWTKFLKMQLARHWDEIIHIKQSVFEHREELKAISLQKMDAEKTIQDLNARIAIHESQAAEQIADCSDFREQLRKMTDKMEALRASQYELRLGHQRILGIGGSINLPAPVYPSPGSPDYHVSYNGELIWKIENLTEKRKDAILNRTTSIISPPFFSKMHEYQLSGRLYPNGEGPAKGKFLSLFFAIMKGPYDALLPWPFRKRITLSILDQKGGQHHEETFKPDSISSSFERPHKDINLASGSPFFMSLEALNTQAYVIEDVMFIKIKIHED